MDRFTARNALLTGVGLIRRRPQLVLSWAALFLALTIVFAVIYQGFMVWVTARGGARLSDLPLLVAAFALVKTLVSLVLSAVVLASAFRAILRPGAPASLRFGREERLVLASQFVTQFAAALPVLLLLAAVLLVHGLGGLFAGSRWIETVFETFGLFWSFVASVWAFGRLEIAPLRCWAIAQGRFWLLAGLVLGVLVLRIFVNAGVDHVIAALNRILPGPPQDNPLAIIVPKLSDVFRAPALLKDVMSAVLEALEIAILAGIVSRAYIARPPEPQAAAFSSVVGDPAS